MTARGDYKYEIQLIAEEIAQDQYGLDFYELLPKVQNEVYEDALEEYKERMAAKFSTPPPEDVGGSSTPGENG